MKAVILAAGKGTRMRSLCEEHPKPLLPLANRPALLLTIERLRQAGVTDVLVIIGHQLEKIQQTLDAHNPGVNLSYIVQEELNGTGGATMLAKDFADGEPFVLVFGDIIAHSSSYTRAIDLFNSGADGVVSTRDIGEPVKYGAVIVEGDRVARIVERPAPDEASSIVNAGLFVFPPEIFEATRNLPPAPSGEHELTGGIQQLIEDGMLIKAMPIEGYWANLTDPDALLSANEDVLEELQLANADLIDETAEIAESAQIETPAAVGNNCRISEDVRIGANVSIGSGSVINAGTKLDRCILFEDVRVGEGVILENVVVAAGSTVPSGTTIKCASGGAAIITNSTFKPIESSTPKGKSACLTMPNH